MIKKITITVLFLVTFTGFSQQSNINNYKYIIVPDRLEIVKKVDQYQTSSLTKFLLAKKGFEVYLSNEKLPDDLALNRCLALTANVVDESKLFTVKNKIVLKDCYGNLVYASELGKSKEKDYKKSYHEAIRNAYKSMEDLEYTYLPKKEVVKVVTEKKLLPIKKEIPIKVVPKVTEVVTPKKENKVEIKKELQNETLYAQTKPNGFQLVNTSPAIVFNVLNTNMNQVYIIKNKNGILYKKGSIWLAEYYENGKLIIKEYNIKF